MFDIKFIGHEQGTLSPGGIFLQTSFYADFNSTLFAFGGWGIRNTILKFVTLLQKDNK